MRFNHPECWREHYDELGGWPENLNHHESGVYIAIHLGDCLGDGRYRVLHKLGNGAFTQVWLAKDQWPGWDLVGRTLPGKLILTGDRVYRGHGYVSIKIVPADASEARILKYLMRCPHHYPGSKNVMKLLDHFTIDTPNVSYEGLILEVMSMNAFRVVQGAPRGKLSMNNGRLTSRQVAKGWNICTNVDWSWRFEPRFMSLPPISCPIVH